MELVELIRAPLIIFLSIVAPLWIIAHYVTRWRMSRSVSQEDETMLSDLWESAARMETRIKNLENILDVEQPDWRTRQ